MGPPAPEQRRNAESERGRWRTCPSPARVDTTRGIKLFAFGTSFVSRSEAKRLTQGLDRFRHVILDFQGVTLVGQGFADEIFRVWSRAHPQIELKAENMIPPVAFMVERARGAAGQGGQIPK